MPYTQSNPTPPLRLRRAALLMRFLTPALALAIGLLVIVPSTAAESRATGPWDTKSLHAVPHVEWGAKDGLVQQVFYRGEPYQGKPTRVFAYYARPEKGDGPFPAMVLLHGGGGKAFAEWAKLWAERGYVAIAMDLAGNGPDGNRLTDGGPNQDDKSKFGEFTDATAREMWTYHAVSSAMLAHSLLAAQKEVDPKRIGVTGISWGGYLTCIVAGVDERFKVAVPVYGCGFIHENSCWVDNHFNKMNAEQRTRWVKHFDPSSYLANVSCPILFVNGTNDFAYPPDSYRKSYLLVDKKFRHLRITVNMPHGHQQGWAPQEIGLFVDSVLKEGKPLLKIEGMKAGLISAAADPSKTYPLVAFAVGQRKVTGAQLHFTTEGGPWQQRKWKSVDAKFRDGNGTDRVLEADMGTDKQATYFFTVRDEHGAITSSAYVEKE